MHYLDTYLILLILQKASKSLFSKCFLFVILPITWDKMINYLGVRGLLEFQCSIQNDSSKFKMLNASHLWYSFVENPIDNLLALIYYFILLANLYWPSQKHLKQANRPYHLVVYLLHLKYRGEERIAFFKNILYYQ